MIIIVNWIAWIFNFGRYRDGKANTKGSVIFIITEMIVKIITDFRHFLALILVLIFAGALIYACSISDGKIDDLSKALQAVVSTLGGLVGSIVGYYFGESAAKSRNNADNNNSENTSTSTTAVQGSPTDSPDAIQEVPPPPQEHSN